jgi:hypothetical protein
MSDRSGAGKLAIKPATNSSVAPDGFGTIELIATEPLLAVSTEGTKRRQGFEKTLG